MPGRACAVALVLERSGSAPVLRIDQRLAVDPERVGPVFAELTAELPAGTVTVLGHQLAPYVDGTRGPVRVAPPDQLCTAVWWELAEALVHGGPSVVVADYDPQLNGLGVLAVAPDVSGPPAGTPS
jgi:hypothetical protein